MKMAPGRMTTVYHGCSLVLLAAVLMGCSGCGRYQAAKAINDWKEQELVSGKGTETSAALQLSNVAYFGPIRINAFKLSEVSALDGSRTATTEAWVRGVDSTQGLVVQRYSVVLHLVPSVESMAVGHVEFIELGDLGRGHQLWTTLWRIALGMPLLGCLVVRFVTGRAINETFLLSMAFVGVWSAGYTAYSTFYEWPYVVLVVLASGWLNWAIFVKEKNA